MEANIRQDALSDLAERKQEKDEVDDPSEVVPGVLDEVLVLLLPSCCAASEDEQHQDGEEDEEKMRQGVDEISEAGIVEGVVQIPSEVVQGYCVVHPAVPVELLEHLLFLHCALLCIGASLHEDWNTGGRKRT